MRKKSIGFIDYFIDEWHANHFPQCIAASALSDQFELTRAYAMIDPPDKKSLATWCQEQGVAQASSIESLVDACDCIFVLSPDNPEHHDALSNHALHSGKPVFIDKPLAPSLQAAKAMFDLAAQHGTPLFSSSGLRFTSALQSLHKQQLAEQPATLIATTGGGSSFSLYLIHQIEMIVALMGTGITRVMYLGTKNVHCLNIIFNDQRRATVRLSPSLGFTASVHCDDGTCHELDAFDDFAQGLMDAVLGFYRDGQSPVPTEQTLQIMAVCETALMAAKIPEVWCDVPSV